MIKKKILISDILDFLNNDVITTYGIHTDQYIDNLADAAHVDEFTLDWVAKQNENQAIAEASKAKVVLVNESVIYSAEMKESGKGLIVVKSPKQALTKIGNHFFVTCPKPGIHPTAIISPDAIIGEEVTIGPYCVIGAATIGDRCVLDSHVRVMDGVVMGGDCDVKAGAVLGGSGFGFVKDDNGNKIHFPQIGGLIIGHHVEIGANTCIDRGALSDTEIGDYTKINNLCHIAHNNKIGRNVTITGCVNISGSNIIDDRAWIAPNASIRGFIHIGEGCVVGMGAVATKDIPAGETWVGNPAKKMEKKK